MRHDNLFSSATPRRWLTNIGGNTAMMFALILLPLMTVVGFVIDHNRQVSAQNKVQSALDFAALSVASYSLKHSLSDDDISRMAQDFFDAEISASTGYSLNDVQTSRKGDEITLSVDGTLPTSIMAIIGTKTMPIGTTASVAFGEPSAAEIALVLDTSYSMTGTRHAALVIAANDFIDTLIKADNESVKASVVPFADYVSIDTSLKGEPWLDVMPDRTDKRKSCGPPDGWREKHCTWKTKTCLRDGISATCGNWDCGGKKAPEICKKATSDKSWYGCVGSRSDPLNIKDADYGKEKVIGLVSSNGWMCPSNITPLTNDPVKLKAAVATLKIKNETYIPAGLSWGLRTLSSQAPFTEGATYAEFAGGKGRKAVVLMSDGANTRSPASDHYHSKSDASKADKITKDMCDEIKANGVEIYTIAFEISDFDTKKMLEDCASDKAYYFDAGNSAKLQAAFADIGQSFREVMLTR